MAKFEIEVQDWQAEVFRKHVGAFLNAQIISDGSAIAEDKTFKLSTWQTKIDSLKEPIPEELLDPVRMAYAKLMRKAFPNSEDLTLHIESLEELNALQTSMHKVFGEYSRGSTARNGAVLVERYGLKTGEGKTLEVTGQLLFFSSSRTRELERRALRTIRDPFNKRLFVPHFITFSS